jgi:hypothetical protein
MAERNDYADECTKCCNMLSLAIVIRLRHLSLRVKRFSHHVCLAELSNSFVETSGSKTDFLIKFGIIEIILQSFVIIWIVKITYAHLDSMAGLDKESTIFK